MEMPIFPEYQNSYFNQNEGVAALCTYPVMTAKFAVALTVLGALRLAEYVTFSDCKKNYFLSE